MIMYCYEGITQMETGTIRLSGMNEEGNLVKLFYQVSFDIRADIALNRFIPYVILHVFFLVIGHLI